MDRNIINLILLDVDGTLTDGKLYVNDDGNIMQSFCIKDGLGLTGWLKLGKEIAIITGRKNNSIIHRANDLGIKHVFTGISDKGKIAKKLINDLDLKKENVAAIGDDLNDISMFKEVGLSFAPANCAQSLRGYVDVILEHTGGNGAVREMIEYLLLSNGEEKTLTSLFI